MVASCDPHGGAARARPCSAPQRLPLSPTCRLNHPGIAGDAIPSWGGGVGRLKRSAPRVPAPSVGMFLDHEDE